MKQPVSSDKDLETLLREAVAILTDRYVYRESSAKAIRSFIIANVSQAKSPPCILLVPELPAIPTLPGSTDSTKDQGKSSTMRSTHLSAQRLTSPEP